jgi:hypothetical protein
LPTDTDQQGENEAFFSLFNRFIELPQNEEERLAAWGIHTDLDIKNADDEKTQIDSTWSSYKIPSDITWPDPRELGALPQNDFRNMRFKLVPLVTEGPWIM